MKMKHKLEKLERTGKPTLSDDIRREQSVLDFKKGSFNAGCRKVTGKNNQCLSVCCVDFDDHLVANHDQLNPGKNKDNYYYL